MRRWNREGQVQIVWHNRKKIAKERERNTRRETKRKQIDKYELYMISRFGCFLVDTIYRMIHYPEIVCPQKYDFTPGKRLINFRIPRSSKFV